MKTYGEWIADSYKEYTVLGRIIYYHIDSDVDESPYYIEQLMSKYIDYIEKQISHQRNESIQN